ncbi:translation initiation factor IF-2 [Treponema socranskii subsp. socranskii VPI DR56BR1116 = ATCC 35536]|uniref:Translation initiation factor IF-2 n=1 Tax=Treponema socranskii subsp. socranskii VPI DR56BR1116 = ATCC 35536 TaxID=1125725 RepID=U1FLF1_TRESO|nr:translation initiation factor IF-2 [Treponema socranskii]ERF60633.1 translation initiation factor IF-2 [Treponema socranskii subsp. socranskii VPI DR56BR1116 = ATCC 35536]ERK00150.1 translation initiation factor IF-2 [Treponema socranskii subsp. socranskii VPI DR56BR1116 = ATCC 35536]
MADEVEKKPEFVIHHKKQPAADKAPASPAEKKQKRVVIVKRASKAVDGAKAERPRIVVKTDVQAPSPQKMSEPAASDTVEKKAPPVSETNVRQPTGDIGTKPVKAAPVKKAYDFNAVRPNVKAGNLSDRNRSAYRASSPRSQGTGYGTRPYRDSTGFTGAQARAGYQNRERENQQGGYTQGRGGRPGFSGTRTGFQGRPARPGFQNGRPGFTGGARPGGYGSPAAVPPPKGPAKKSFKGKKQVYRKTDEQLEDDKFFAQKKKAETPANAVPKSIDIMESISVSDLARKMNLKASDIIQKLMSQGMMVTINQSIDSDTATLVASEYGCEVHLVSLYDETVIESDKDNAETVKPRPPIVTVMGHVDHGKTKTLDAIRHSHVADGEFGGITQSIGAYSVSTEKGTITFLDTPGHEAFTMMRARGAQVTDIVVLVVAADDGVMPQTLEAINHAKDAKVPIIVAVNKIDKPEANPDRVRTQLSEHGLTPEDWGGDTQYVNISALKGEGIDDLLDAVLLQAEMLELKADYNCRAEGKILESRVDQGRGIVATVVVQRGTLHQGDPFVAGIYSGHVRAMFNDRGKRIQEASPSMPVEVLGIESMPNAGDPFQVTESEKDAREVSVKRQELKRFEEARAVKKVTLENLYQTIDASNVKEFRVIIKADLQGSAEALKTALEKLSTKDIRLVVIHSSAGAINESDVTLASADRNAIIIGFNVRPTAKAKLLADQERVEIRKYSIIYKAVEEVQAAMEGMLTPDTKEEVTGTLEVRNTFKVPRIGVIAGCYVTDGIIKRSGSVHLIRDGIVKFTGKISSLKRFKDDAKEVAAGYECGVGIEDWQDIQVGDTLEAFELIKVARKLGDSLAEEAVAADSGEGEKE